MAISKSKAVARTEAYYDNEQPTLFISPSGVGRTYTLVPTKMTGKRSPTQAGIRLRSWQANCRLSVTRILDLGSGYGGSGRYLARRFGAHVTCLQLSTTQNALNHELTWRVAY